MRYARIRHNIVAMAGAVATASVLLLASCGGGGNVGPEPDGVDESSARHLPIRISIFQIQPESGLVVYQILASSQWTKLQGADWRTDAFADAGEKLWRHLQKQQGKKDGLFAITGKPLANFDVPDFWMEKTVESMEASGIRDLPSRKKVDAEEILRLLQGKRKEDRFIAVAVVSPSVNTVIVSRDIWSLSKDQQDKMFPQMRNIVAAFTIMFNKFRPAYSDRGYTPATGETPAPPRK